MYSVQRTTVSIYFLVLLEERLNRRRPLDNTLDRILDREELFESDERDRFAKAVGRKVVGVTGGRIGVSEDGRVGRNWTDLGMILTKRRSAARAAARGKLECVSRGRTQVKEESRTKRTSTEVGDCEGQRGQPLRDAQKNAI